MNEKVKPIKKNSEIPKLNKNSSNNSSNKSIENEKEKTNPKQSKPDVGSLNPFPLYCGNYRIDGIEYYINFYELSIKRAEHFFTDSVYKLLLLYSFILKHMMKIIILLVI